MRTLLLLLALLLAGCIDHPSARVTSPDGTVTDIRMGRNLMGKQKQTVAQVKGPNGWEFKFMEGESNATDVPRAIVTAAGAAYGANILGKVDMNASDNATKEALGAQDVTKNKDLLNAQGAAFGTATEAGGPVGQAVPPGGIPIQ